MDIWKASKKLDSLDIKARMGNLQVNVLGFRSDGYNGGWRWPRHRHSFYEFHFIAQGRDHIVIEDESYVVNKGEFYLTGPGIYHEQHSLAEDGLVEYGLQCEFALDSCDGARELDESGSVEWTNLLSIFNASSPSIQKDKYGAIKLFNKALEEALHQRPGYYTNIKLLTIQILISAARSLGVDKKLEDIRVPKKNRDESIINKINLLVSNNYSSTLNVRDIAAMMYLSDKQLNRIVKQNTGKSVHEYITSLKLQNVQHLLKSTSYTLREIAEKTGFANEFHLSRVFKQYIGINTLEYRRGRTYSNG